MSKTAVKEKPQEAAPACCATIPTRALRAAIDLCAKASPGRTVLSVLECVHIRAEGSGLTLTTCNGEQWIRTVALGWVEGEWTACPKMSAVRTFVASAPGDDVEVVLEGNTLSLKSGPSSLKLSCLDAEDFPVAPEPDSEPVSIAASDLRDALESTVYAVWEDKKDQRPALMGVYFDPGENELRLAATNTHQVAVVTINSVVPGKAFVAPTEACRAAMGLDGDTLRLYIGKQLVIEGEGGTIITQPIGDAYPNYARVFPAETTRRWIVNSDELEAAIKRLVPTARDSARRVRLKGEADGIRLYARNEVNGEAEDFVSAVSTNAEDFEIAFNYDYLLDQCQGGALTLEMTEYSRPMQILSDAKPNWKGLVMPMALS